MHKNILLLGLLLVAIVFQGPAIAKAQNPPQPQSSPPLVVKTISQAELDLIKEHYKNLKEQNEALRMSIKDEREKHYEFVKGTYEETRNFVYVFIGLASVFIGFLNWKTKDDLKKDLTEFKKEIRQSAELKFHEAINNEVGNIEENFVALNKIVSRETSYKKKRIAIIGNLDQLEKIGEVLDFLERKKFEYQAKKIDESSLEVNELELTDSDIFIYLLKDPDEKLSLILDRLKDTKIPIVVFADKGLRIPNDIMAKYDWILPANSSITLINSIFTVSNVLSE